MGYLEGFGVTIRQHRLFGGTRVTGEYSGGRRARKKGSEERDVEGDEKLPRSPRLKELRQHPAGEDAAAGKDAAGKDAAGKGLRLSKGISRDLQQLQDHNMPGPEDDAPNTFMPSRAEARCAPMNLLPPPPTASSAAAKGGKAKGSFGCPRCRWAPRGCDRCWGKGDPGRRVRART